MPDETKPDTTPKTETTATPAPEVHGHNEGKIEQSGPDKAAGLPVPEVNSIYEHEEQKAAQAPTIEDYDDFRANQPDHLGDLAEKTADARKGKTDQNTEKKDEDK